MANFTEKQIQQMMTALKWDYGIDNSTRELAILELEDLKRKGCTLENIGECYGCSATKDGSECPLCDWEKRHPEYADDELATKITILEAGGEDAYKAKLAAQEAKKKAVENKKKAVEKSKQTLFADVLMHKFATTEKDNAKWTDDFEAHLEAYVQARIAAES